jgi:DNA-binding protein YbaB
MDIPLHPVVVAEMERGREFLVRIRAARQALADAQVSIPFPDGPGSLTFNGEAMLIAADIPEDIFERYPGAEDLSDVLTAMCQEGYRQLTHTADQACLSTTSDLKP